MNPILKYSVLGLLAFACTGFAGEVKKLPTPAITGGMPIMDAINARQSGRLYDKNRTIDDQTLSEILWVAWGMNAHSKRTIATAVNKQNMALYVLRTDGTWQYNAKDNELEKINDKNLLAYCDTQPFVKDAPLHLLFVAQDDRYGKYHIGSAYQNVYLYATSKGLATVIRGWISDDDLAASLGLQKGTHAFLHQTVGWPEKD